MGLGLLIAGGVFAGVAALIHVLIWIMESIGWRQPRIWHRFGLRSQEEADVVAPMAFNQGFYNLFLAVGVVVGLVLLGTPVGQAGLGVVLFCVACMFGASVVLLASRRELWRSALAQGVAPLIATVLLVLAVA